MSTKPAILYRVSASAEQPADISAHNVKGTPLSTLEIDANWKSVVDELAKRATESNPEFAGTVRINSTGAIKMPGGDTSERVINPEDGMLRWNTDARCFEYYDEQYTYLVDGEVVTGGWRRLASVATGESNNYVYFVNDNAVKYDTEVMGVNQNAVSAGPLTINDGVTLTVDDTSTFTIL